MHSHLLYILIGNVLVLVRYIQHVYEYFVTINTQFSCGCKLRRPRLMSRLTHTCSSS